MAEGLTLAVGLNEGVTLAVGLTLGVRCNARARGRRAERRANAAAPAGREEGPRWKNNRRLAVSQRAPPGAQGCPRCR